MGELFDKNDKWTLNRATDSMDSMLERTGALFEIDSHIQMENIHLL